MPASSAQAPPTTPGNLQPFRRWMEDVLERPCSWGVLRKGIKFEDPEDLSGLIEVVREAEIACFHEMQDLNQRMRCEREDAGGGKSCIGLIVHSEEYAFWSGRLNWLQDSRVYLEKQQQHRHEATTGRHGCEGEL